MVQNILDVFSIALYFVATKLTTKRQRGEGGGDLMSLDDDYKEDKDDLDSDEDYSEEEVRNNYPFTLPARPFLFLPYSVILHPSLPL